MSGQVGSSPGALEWPRPRSEIAEEDRDRRFHAVEAWKAHDAVTRMKQLQEVGRTTRTQVGFPFVEEPSVRPMPVPVCRTASGWPAGPHEAMSADLLDVVCTCEACDRRSPRVRWLRQRAVHDANTVPTPGLSAAAIVEQVEAAPAQLSESAPSSPLDGSEGGGAGSVCDSHASNHSH